MKSLLGAMKLFLGLPIKLRARDLLGVTGCEKVDIEEIEKALGEAS